MDDKGNKEKDIPEVTDDTQKEVSEETVVTTTEAVEAVEAVEASEAVEDKVAADEVDIIEETEKEILAEVEELKDGAKRLGSVNSVEDEKILPILDSDGVDVSDIFITEDDTFDVSILYYKVEDDICVDTVDDEFDVKHPDLRKIDITFKYPSQGDYEAIIAQNGYKAPDQMSLIDVMQMELTRLVVLIRKWSLDVEFGRMVDLDPKFVKGMANQVREKIGIKGIL